MDVVKTATDWTRAEMLASGFFVLAGTAFLLASFGFWQAGRTDVARAYVVPMPLAGGLLAILGVGLFLSGEARLASVPAAYATDETSLLAAEIVHVEKVANDYRIAVLRVFPAIVALCARLIPFVDAPLWRASLITAVAMLTPVLLVDTNADARLRAYAAQLALAQGRPVP